MLRRKALKKIIMTTFSVFIILLVYLIPDAKIKDLPTNLDIEYVTNIATNSIYLLNNNNYLVKTNILIDETDLIKKIEKQVKALIISKNNSFPKGLKALIPLDTKLLDVVMEEKIAILNFSKEFLSISKELESSLIEAIVFSVLDFDEVEGIKIKIEGQDLTKLPHSLKNIPEVLTKEIGINRVYSINSRNDIQKIVIYYVEDIIKKEEPFSEWQIRNIHQLILNNIDDDNAGRYRQQNVLISGAT
ncbi:MAG: GerMN domain-containing protein, partial [Bacilli bacterium]